jgi:hypothetical protein
MKTTKLSEQDILDVAQRLKMPINEQEVQLALNTYDVCQADDPSATWDLVVENMLYNITEPRNHKLEIK